MFFILYHFCNLVISYWSTDELPYILNDDDYTSKYRANLKTAVLRAKARPGTLFEGYDVCISAHAQPPLKTLSVIVKSAGGNVSSLFLYNSYHVDKCFVAGFDSLYYIFNNYNIASLPSKCSAYFKFSKPADIYVYFDSRNWACYIRSLHN